MTDETTGNLEATEATEGSVSSTETTNFSDLLSEDLRGEASLQDFKDVNALAKSYVSAQRMLGGSVRIPTEDASDEAKQEFFDRLTSIEGVAKLPDMDNKEEVNAFLNKLGRPEDASQYTLNIPEDVKLDEERVTQFKQLAHDIGLTNKQAEALAAYDTAQQKAIMEESIQQSEIAQKALKEAWGTDYDNRLAGAKEALKAYSDRFPEAAEALVTGPSGNNPALLMMLSDLYGATKETSAAAGGNAVQYGVSPMEAQDKINEIFANPNHPYFDEKNTSHKAAVEKVNKLFNIVSGGN